jgi:endonuclease/exonuclease/phosphatase family metal-dependent hydrolase
MVELRLLTLNLTGTGCGWFEGRRAACVHGIRALAPDVVCLQEVSSRTTPYPYDQVQDLSERLDLPYSCFAPYGNPDEVVSQSWGGVAILARWPFWRTETLQLPPGPTPPDARVGLLAAIAHSEGPVHVLATHLSWPVPDHDTRDRQVAHALSRVRDLGWDRPGRRFVFAGDLNAVESEAAIARLREHLQDAYRVRHPDEPGLTWTHANPLVWYDSPDRRLDYLFVDTGSKVVGADVVLTDREIPVSDHYGLLATLRWSAGDP